MPGPMRHVNSAGSQTNNRHSAPRTLSQNSTNVVSAWTDRTNAGAVDLELSVRRVHAIHFFGEEYAEKLRIVLVLPSTARRLLVERDPVKEIVESSLRVKGDTIQNALQRSRHILAASNRTMVVYLKISFILKIRQTT